MKNILGCVFCLISYLMSSCNNVSPGPDVLAANAMSELKTVLREQSQFVKVHAAEYLIWLGQTGEVRKIFMEEDSLHRKESPYRIGIWRVLAQTEAKPADKMNWINKVFAVYADRAAPDRLHATETLAKLQQSPLEKYPLLTQETLLSDNRNLHTYGLWAVSYSSDSAMKKNRVEFLRMALTDTNQVIRKISAFILGKTKGLSEAEWTTLANQALTEPDSSEMKLSLLNAAFVTSPPSINTDLIKTIKKEMLKGHEAFSPGQNMELALSLAEKGDEADLPLLHSMLNQKESADLRATAAYAILKIKM